MLQANQGPGPVTRTEILGARPPIRVVLADDAYLVRVALTHLLEERDDMTVVGECEDGRAVARTLDEQRADLLITDIRMPPSDDDEGIRLAARLRETHPALGVIVLSTWAEIAYALKLFESGFDSRGYLLRDRIRDRGQIIDAVRMVASGGTVVDPRIIEDLLHSRTDPTTGALDELTPRELETLALVAEGKSNAAIAETRVGGPAAGDAGGFGRTRDCVSGLAIRRGHVR